MSRRMFALWQFVWMVLVFFIFTATWLVQAGAIDMPDWTKDLRKYEGEEWSRYAAILSASVCVVFILAMATGVAALRAGNI